MNKKNHLDIFCVSIMILLCALWGFQQVAIKAVIADISPTWQAGVRSLIAAWLLGLWIVIRKRHTWIRGLRTQGILAGILFSLEFGLLYIALHYTDASRVVLLVYTAPFVVAVGAHWWIAGERLSLQGWLGVTLAFIGTATVLQTSTNSSTDNQRLLGDLLALSGGIAWGATTLLVRISALSNAPPTQTLWYQLCVSGLILCPLAWLLEGSFSLPQTSLGWASITFQIIGIAVFSYLTWFALITRYSVTKLSVFSFLTPLFGAFYGILLLNEQLDSYHFIALLLTIIGIILVSRYGHEKTTPK